MDPQEILYKTSEFRRVIVISSLLWIATEKESVGLDIYYMHEET